MSQSCGNCEHWRKDKRDSIASFGACVYQPIPFAYEDMMQLTAVHAGENCPCWKEKGGDNEGD